MKPRTKRVFTLTTLLGILGGCLFLIFDALQDNMVFYVTPTELKSKISSSAHKTLRIGGYVKEGSFHLTPPAQSTFVLTDFTHEVTVHYQGVLPSLFREGQGAVAEGTLLAGTLSEGTQVFNATQVLAKHDENYKPPQGARGHPQHKGVSQ